MQTLRQWLLRRVETPLRAAVELALSLLILAIGLGVLVSTFGEDASLSIAATTESVTMTNTCENTSLDLVLSPGQLRQLSLAPGDVTPLNLTSPTLIRLAGLFKVSMRRRAGEPLQLTFGPSSAGTDVADRWSATVFGPDLPAGDPKNKLTPLQMTYVSAPSHKDGDSIALPVAGHVILGEATSTNYGGVSETIPRPAYLLLKGAIRVRAAVWGSSRRIDLAEHALELGDVVDTERQSSGVDAADSRSVCSGQQAQGMVRLDKDGALHAIVHVDQDKVSVIRGRVVSVGSSKVENFTQQPIVRLAWQGAVIMFLLIGVLQQLFDLVAYYSQKRASAGPSGPVGSQITNEQTTPKPPDA